MQVPAGSGDGVYKWYMFQDGFYPKGTGEKFEATLPGTYFYSSCGINYDDPVLISFRKSVVILDSKPAVSGPIVIGTGIAADPKLTGSDIAAAPPSGYNTLYEWKNLTRGTAIVPGSNLSINPFSATNGGVGVYQLIVKKSTSTDVSAVAQCVAPALKTEVYPRGAGCTFDFATSNGTVVSCDGLAKITITHNNNGSTLPAGAVVAYRLDLDEWQSSNIISNVPYGKHTVSIRMTNGSQICYATRELGESNFDVCGKLSCDFEIIAKDNLGNETSTIPRDPTTKGLKALTLSVESFDGSDITRGVSYYWNSFAKNPHDGGGGPLLLSTQSIATASTVGKYTVDLTRAGVTCSAEIILGSTPCINTPETTTKCETKALTGITDEIPNRLRSLAPGDVVRCGDFNVTVLEIIGGPFEGWTGKGFVRVPYMNAEVSIVFQKAVFNDCYQLTNANATPTQPTVFTEYNSDFFVKKLTGNGSPSDDDYSAEEEAEQIGEAQKIIDLNTTIADEMKAFNCDNKQKERLNKAIADLEAVRLKAQANELYTPEQKAQISTSVTNITTLVNSLLSCCVSSSNGRIAADGVCSTTPNAILTKATEESKALETLPKPAVVPKSTTIYVNGYWNDSYLMKDLLNLSDGEKLKGYWGEDFTNTGGQNTVDNNYFVNGARKMFSSGEERYQEGKKFVEERLKNKVSIFYQKVIRPTQDKNGNYISPIYLISHSMGAAYAEGMIDAFLKAGVKINKVYHFSPADNNDFSVNLPAKTIQIDIIPDPVLLYKNFDDANHINGVIHWGLFNVPSSMSQKTLGHAYTKSRTFVWDWAKIIENLNVITLPGYPSSYKIFTPAPNHYHPQKMCINGTHYHFTGNSEEADGSFSSIYSLGF